jgi:hypothetical protein
MPTRKVFLRINPTKKLPTIALFERLIYINITTLPFAKN